VLILTPDRERTGILEENLAGSNYAVSFGALDRSDWDHNPADLIVIDGPADQVRDAIDCCARIRSRYDGNFIPILMVTDDAGMAVRAMSLEMGADGHLSHPVDFLEFLRLVKAFVRIKGLQDEVQRQSEQLRLLNRKLQLVCDQVDQELRFARKIQVSFLPQQLPSRPGIRFAVKYAVSGTVSGDTFDIVDLDDDTIAFYVADAMGHGVPAGLLTIYVKKGIRLTDDNGPIPPGKVLESLNVDLLNQNLSDNPFISMVHFTLDTKRKLLRHARAGHPPPVLIRHGELLELNADGALIGVYEGDYETQELALESGDKVVVLTDGIDSVRYQSFPAGPPSFFACLRDHRHLPVSELLETLYQILFPDRQHEDDLTLLAMEID
jgi:serine phosphatase RsbU (regulator of sigma subunit)